MNRRDYIASLGSAVTAGLTGCMDLVTSNSDDNQGADDPTDQSGSGTQEGTNIDFFTTAVNCASGPGDEIKFISSPEEDKNIYEFNGQLIVPTPCHDAVASARMEENTLKVELDVVNPTGECDEGCTGLVSYAGSVTVDDSIAENIENTELII